MQNVFDLVTRSALSAPDAEALTDGIRRLSYATLQREIEAVAAGLRDAGIMRGDRVAVFLDKRIETVEAIFGSAAAGGVFVPINPLLKPEQVVHILADSGARCLITSATRVALLAKARLDRVVLERVFTVDQSEAMPSALGRAACGGWQDLVSRGVGTPQSVPMIDTDLAAILYTSGSTGLPKGVVLTHRNLLEGAWSVATYLGNHAKDRMLAALPLSFDAGLSQLTTAFHAGATAVLVNYLAPQDVIGLCERERITGLTAVPPLWIQLSKAEWPDAARRHLRYFANTGGRMPRATLDSLRELFPKALPYLMYGLTEAFRSTYLDPREVDRRPDSIGKAVPNARILVVRPDGTPCQPQEVGELVHIGAFVAKGYWNDAERTALRYRLSPERQEGVCLAPEMAVWSGDLVRQDAEGYLYFVGRNDSLIKTSGYRVSPEEIEEAVLASGLVGEVVAVGVPDEELGQSIAIVATPPGSSTLDTEALRNHCRRTLPPYMVPKEIHVRAALPRNPNGKFDRPTLQRELVEHKEAV